MTVQDNVQSLIRELEQILWQDKLKEHPDVSILLEKIRHHLLMGQSSLNNNDDLQAEQLSEIILHRLEVGLGNHILPVEVQQLHHQREALLEEIAKLQQEKQAIVSTFSQKLSTQTTLSPSPKKTCKINPITTSVDKDFQPLLEKLNLYSDSLEEGIERMYQLGQQGETRFLAYLHQLQEKIESFSNKQKEENRTITNDIWYLGLSIEGNQIEGYLFTFCSEKKSLRKLEVYCLSELLRLCKLTVSAHENLLENVKEKLTAFNQMIELSFVKVAHDIFLKNILEKLKAIVLVGSSNWTKKDRNLLEKIVTENLKLSQAKEIIWIPQPIALTLSYTSQNISKEAPLSCVINLAGTTTELSIIDLSKVSISGIISQQLFYGLQSINQDVFCQLIYPQWAKKAPSMFSNFFQTFPTPGMAETYKRKTLKEHLKNNSLGNNLIEASQLTRLILQEQEYFTCSLLQNPWSVNRQEMIERVINPWIKTVNEKLKTLLSQGQHSRNSISQIILAGEGTNSLNYALIPWLTQMFPNGKVIQAEQPLKDGQLFAGLQDFLANERDNSR
ncbi:MAG: hypothetical protein AB4063_15505 [Crocosphaera sp.]